MDVQPGDPAEEIKRLQRCINDLVSLFALPATWSGGEPSEIIRTLLDSLLRMLQLDLVYVRLKDPDGQAPIELVRFCHSQEPHSRKHTAQPHEIGTALKPWLEADPQEWPPLIPNPIGDGDLSTVSLGLGLQGEIGVIVAGSERADFPRQTERLILSVAANQASIGLQEARLLHEQKRVASELDRRVAQRTAELAATNQALTEEIAERKVIEERARESEVSLKKSEAKLRQVVDTIPALSWCNRTDGTNEFLNKRWHEYTGLSPEEAHGWGWQMAFHPEDLPALMERWQELLISGESGEIEARLRRYDGAYRWFLISVSPFVDEAGTIVRWYGTSTDIDDRKLAEEALRSRALDFSLIINTMPALAWSAWPDGRLDFCNQRWLNYTGLSPAQAQDWGWAQACHPDDLGLLTNYWQSIIATGESGEIEARLRRFDGEYRWFLFRAEPLRDESGAIVRWYGTNSDIDDRKHAEEDLRSSEEKHRLVVETANDAVVSMDDNGTIQFANPASARIFGYDPAELVGQPLTVLMPEFMRELHDRGFRRYLATGHRHINWQGTELTALRKDGQEFPVEVSFGERTRDGHKVFTGFIRDISERKQAADKLRASERSLRELTETIPQMLWSAEEDGTVNYCNQRTLDYTGLSAEEVRGSGWLTAVHPDDLEKATRAWLGSVTRGEAFQCEFRFRRAPEGYRWCISNAVPLRDLEGKVLRWFGAVVDLHDWREAQQALHAIQTRQVAVRSDVSLAFGQKESLEAILDECAESLVRHLDAAFARIWTLSRDGRMLELRASAGLYTHLHGAHSRIPVGQLKIGTIAREQKHVLTNDVINDPRISDKTWAANEGMSSFAGYPLLVGTRTVGVVAMFSRKPLTTGTAEALASIADLIAHGIERKRAEDKLRASERDLSLIIETIPGLVWCAGSDGELNYLNQRLLDYTGTSPDAWAQLGWKNLLHPDDAEPTAQAWSRAVATGQPHEAQCRLRRSDGVYRWFQVLGQAARDSEGGVARWYGLLIDIDDRKNMEEALRDSQVRLSRAIQTATVGEFAAAIAHEINQPLAAVVANGQACLRWLAAQPPGMDKAHETAERIVRDGKEAGDVVRRIRALFKQAAVEKIELNLNEVISEVLHLLNGEAARRRVAVETDLGRDLAPVVGDRVQLQQLVFNLLLNGIEAMDSVADRPKKLFISSKQPNPEAVLVEVRDCGIGLKDPDRIFDAFFTTKENGMGMGLAICRSIVDAHQGRLWAASGEGAGTTFSFTLPVQRGVAWLTESVPQGPRDPP